MSSWYLVSNPSSLKTEYFVLFRLLFSGSIEKSIAFLKSLLTRFVLKNVVPNNSDLSNEQNDKSASEKSVSLKRT